MNYLKCSRKVKDYEKIRKNGSKKGKKKTKQNNNMN